MTQEETQERFKAFFKMLADAGCTTAFVLDPPPGCTVHARLTPDGAIMCQTVEGGEMEIEPCAGAHA